MSTNVIYEISFSVEDQDRFERQFPELVLECSTHKSVRTFRVYRGVDGSYTRLRLLIVFEGYYGWRWFTQLEFFRDAMSLLESICTDVETTLWTTSGVSLARRGVPTVEPLDGLISLGEHGSFEADDESFAPGSSSDDGECSGG